MPNCTEKFAVAIAAIFSIVLIPIGGEAAAPKGPREMSPIAKPIEHDDKVFSPDPSYEDKPYSPQNQN